MAKIQLPPKKDLSAPAPGTNSEVSEKKIQDIIRKGGSVYEPASTEATEKFKNINIRILESELATINQLRDKRPKARGRKLSISIHDWIVEAITEKIDREKQTF